jgi:hypothetical protein
MAQEEYRLPIKEFLDMLADLLAEKYFERMDDRMKKIALYLKVLHDSSEGLLE